MKYKPKKESIIACDLDGTLCHNEGFTEEACMFAKPNKEMIRKVNEFHRNECFIIIYTARREFLRFATEYWLKKNGVEYNILDIGNKVWADVYIDDRNVLLKDI